MPSSLHCQPGPLWLLHNLPLTGPAISKYWCWICYVSYVRSFALIRLVPFTGILLDQKLHVYLKVTDPQLKHCRRNLLVSTVCDMFIFQLQNLWNLMANNIIYIVFQSVYCITLEIFCCLIVDNQSSNNRYKWNKIQSVVLPMCHVSAGWHCVEGGIMLHVYMTPLVPVSCISTETCNLPATSSGRILINSVNDSSNMMGHCLLHCV